MASNFIAETTPDAPHIVGICGSLSADSATRRVLVLALEAAQRAGATTQLLDLRELHLPFAASNFDPAAFPDAARFNQLLRQSDGQIWATPEYHGSYSGALKNALDLGYFEEYEGKVVALLGTAGGQVGALSALSHLRGVARQLHAWVLPSQVSIARASGAFDQNGHLRDEKLAQSVEKLGQELAKWALLHRQSHGK
ncbi:MAG: NAD(P)H-dependent oxidoreductase [Armatimonadetes bacterium]|nr:NAD(P)H-dependent oxidoreductase [Armatimonadota bacterium]